MKSFKDVNGKDWIISINVGSIKRVRDLLGINLLDCIKSNLIDDLKSDPITLVDVLYCLVKEQADKAGISDINFGEAMAGDALEQATDAFLEELINFFPSQKRGLLAKAMDKVREAEKVAMERAEKQLEELDVNNLTSGN